MSSLLPGILFIVRAVIRRVFLLVFFIVLS